MEDYLRITKPNFNHQSSSPNGSSADISLSSTKSNSNITSDQIPKTTGNLVHKASKLSLRAWNVGSDIASTALTKISNSNPMQSATNILNETLSALSFDEPESNDSTKTLSLDSDNKVNDGVDDSTYVDQDGFEIAETQGCSYQGSIDHDQNKK
ncbi:uncharacterized protein L201_000461 [Kwoniella dendrophila CBS 6074]|uniref:Uncharacterized protein n=1 Tax=Kwoniella dendrophila CBS 6074 TaxID=1295534 RepID=A0AAX4JJJ3_9TREE